MLKVPKKEYPYFDDDGMGGIRAHCSDGYVIPLDMYGRASMRRPMQFSPLATPIYHNQMSQSTSAQSAPIQQPIPHMISGVQGTFVPQQVPPQQRQLLQQVPQVPHQVPFQQQQVPHMGMPYPYLQQAPKVLVICPKLSVCVDGKPQNLPYFLIQVNNHMNDFDRYYCNDGEWVRDIATSFEGDAAEWYMEFFSQGLWSSPRCLCF
uniref:Uncharacterized protein n=1 Tax=Sphaerodactylus townsendi TaxID=933632 RepID=A0ACB8FGD3_9SAUR